MYRMLLALALLSSAGAPAWTQTATPTNPEAEAVLRVTDAYLEGTRTGNRAMLERILSEHFHGTLTTGTIQGRTEFIDRYGSGRTRVLNSQRNDADVQVIGNTAIVRSRSAITFEGAAPQINAWTHTLMKENGQWRIVAIQSTRLESALMVSSYASGSGNAADSGLEQALTDLYRQMMEAVRTKDVATLGGILAPTYVFTNNGVDQAMTREQRLEAIADQDDALRQEFDIHGCRIQPYVATAVGSCQLTQRAEMGAERHTARILSTVTFVRADNGQWQIAATHASAARTQP
jgi:ketosteroid isomerase-like protein